MFWKGKTLCYHVQTAEEISNLTFLPSNSHASIVTHCLILMILMGKQVMPKNQRHSTAITRSRSLPVHSVAVNLKHRQCRSRFLQFLRSLHDSLQQNQSRKTAQLYYSVPEDKGTV